MESEPVHGAGEEVAGKGWLVLGLGRPAGRAIGGLSLADPWHSTACVSWAERQEGEVMPHTRSRRQEGRTDPSSPGFSHLG